MVKGTGARRLRQKERSVNGGAGGWWEGGKEEKSNQERIEKHSPIIHLRP